MAMSKKLRVTIKRIFWVFIPPILVFGVGVMGLSLYLIHYLAHPVQTQMYGSPRDFEIILQKQMWSDEKWKNSDSTQSVGWFLTREKPAPAVVLTHAYGSNRSELLSLSFELWKAGYHVLVHDMRGHGESPTSWSGLGTYEADDLLSAVNYLKGMKNEAGDKLVDGRIGLYGVDLGGYASIVASSQDPMVKAVAVDSVYPDVSQFIKTRLRAFVGTKSKWANTLVESKWTNRLTDLAVQLYLLRREDSTSAIDSLGANHGRHFLFITAKDTGDQEAMTRDLARSTKDQKEIVEFQQSRLKRLYDTVAADYDTRVVQFFREAMPTSEKADPGMRAAK